MGQKENFAEGHGYAKFSDIILDLEGELNPQELVCLAGSRDLNNLSAASNP
jgi:hypothetical protein